MAEPIGAGDGSGAGPQGGEPAVSVVVITKNERERIGACLDSVFAACDPLESFEVVLVDSRSTDGTVEVAAEYPITVLQLPDEPAPTPSAGRFVGTAATSGDLVLFVDGDMVLEEGWLGRACERVRADPRLAGVDGHFDAADVDEARPTDVLRGVALYDRSALADVGGFDPFLRSMEDIDLSYRLAAAGYRLLRLGEVVATHPPRNAEDERDRRWANGYYHGRGELFRKYLARPRLFARLLYRTRLYAAVLAWAGAGAASASRARAKGLAAWTVGTLAGLLGVSALQGRDWTVDKLASCAPVFVGTALGFAGRQPRREEYPLARVETVRTAPEPTERVGVAAP